MQVKVEKHTNRSSRRAGWILGSIVVVVAAAGAGGCADSRESTEQRLRVLEDRAEIEQLIISDYGNAIDLTDTKALSALFTEDGEFSSEWTDMDAMPEPLRAMFTKDGGSLNVDNVRPRISFKGRPTIANYMSSVFNDRPEISFEKGAAIATFTSSSAPGGQTDGPTSGGPAPADKTGAPPNPMLERFVSMKHLITNPTIKQEGDNATATSYWIEIAVSKDGKQSLAGGGYYSDVLQRVNGVWRFKQRVIHNYDIGLDPRPSR